MTDQNVFILSGDSLRYDRALDKSTMSYITNEASDGYNFTNAVSNAGFTPGSFPSMMASRYPSSINGVGIPAEGSVTTLAEELSRAGYTCGVWSDNKFVGADYNYDRGYTAGQGYENNVRDTVRKYIDEESLLFKILELGYMQGWQRVKNMFSESHYYDSASVINKKAREWLEQKDPEEDQVHIWLHYMDTHHPYEPPNKHMPDDLEVVEDRSMANNLTRRVCADDGDGCSDAEIRDAIRLYDAECRYLDEQIRNFVEEFLKPAGWFTEEDLLVITSDHGEILEEYNTWGEFGHGNYHCEPCTRVPLIFSGSGLESKNIDKQVSLVHLAPTILDICDIQSDYANETMFGNSLMNDDHNEEKVFYDGTLDYCGARSQNCKRFNDETVGEIRYRNVIYDHRHKNEIKVGYDEQVVDGDDEHELLSEFIEERLTECEQLAEGTSAIDPESLQVQQHIKDLGYLE
jgi:arylsulfatase A-like enzyme